jgi:cell division protein FtsB
MLFFDIVIRGEGFHMLQEKTKEVRDLKTRMQSLLEEKDALTAETQELTKQRAKLELNIKDLRDEEAGDKTSKVNKLTTSSAMMLFLLHHTITIRL